jgi:hypothetical protein
LPWVKEAGLEAARVAQTIALVPIKEDVGGPVNVQRERYQEQLTAEMNSFLADIENDKGYGSVQKTAADS